MGLSNREEWLTNPLVYWAHEWAFNPMAEPIGKGTRLDVTREMVSSAAEYAPTAKAQNVRALVLGGFVRKTSVGFDSLEMADIKGVPTHTRWALREWSVVPMPANTDATIVGVKSALRWLADEVVDPADAPTGDHQDVTITPESIIELVTKTVDARLDLFAVPDGAVTIVEKGRRIATIRPRRVAYLSR